MSETANPKQKYGLPPKRLLHFFLICFVLAALGSAWPSIVFLGYVFFAIPGLILAFAPAGAVISGIFILGMLAFHRLGKMSAFAGGIILTTAVFLVPPLYVNAKNAAAIQTELKPDIEAVTPTREVSSVIIRQQPFTDYGQKRTNERSCDDLCHVLLLNGLADSVTMAGPAPNSGTRYRFVKNRICENRARPENLRWSGFADNFNADQLRTAIAIRESKGDCIVGDGGLQEKHDLAITLVETTVVLPKTLPLADLWATAFMLEIENQQGVIHRETKLKSSSLFTPLMLHHELHWGGDPHYEGLRWITKSRNRYGSIGAVRKISSIEAALGEKLSAPKTFDHLQEERIPSTDNRFSADQ